MNNKRIKSIIAWILCLVMVLASINLPAFTMEVKATGEDYEGMSSLMPLSEQEGATAGKYVVTLQPIKAERCDFYELSFEILKDDNRLFYSGNFCENYMEEDEKWAAKLARVELTEEPTDILIKMMYRPNAEGAEYEEVTYKAPFSLCKDLQASSQLYQYPDWGEVDFCKYSIQSTEGIGDLYYIDVDGNRKVRHQGEYEVFRGIFETKSSADEAWYAVTEDISIQTVTALGNVHLILCDGSRLDVYQSGIYVAPDSTLTIYGQENGSGILRAVGKYSLEYTQIEAPYSSTPGIGGEGNIVINGGQITAIGGTRSAGIGSVGVGRISSIPDDLTGGVAGDITINGGYVNAIGGSQGAGIGGGYEGKCGKITINGGTVEAVAGYNAAAIGGGNQGYENGSLNGTCGGIYINGGVVKAEIPEFSSSCAAAIGAGACSIQDFEIVITGGYVEAKSGQFGAGIGSCRNDNDAMPAGVITISGEDTEVYASSVYGAGIGSAGTNVGFNAGKGASGENMKITIKDGAYVYAVSMAGGAGIGGGVRGDGGTIIIDNATVVAHGGASHVRGWSGELNPTLKRVDLGGLKIMEAYINEAIADVLMDVIYSEDLSGAGIGGGGGGGKTGRVSIRNGSRVEAQCGYMTHNAIGPGNHIHIAINNERDIYEKTKVSYGNYASDNKTIEMKGTNPLATEEDASNLSMIYDYVLIEPADLTVNFDLGKDDEVQDIVIKGGPMAPVTVSTGKTIIRPDDPVYDGEDKTKEYIFDDWYKDPEYRIHFNFDEPIYHDTTVYGHWTKAYPLTVTQVWKENQTKPEKVVISYVNQYKKNLLLEDSECTKKGTITLSENNGWKETIPVTDTTILTLSENVSGYTAESWTIKCGENNQILSSPSATEQGVPQDAVQLTIRDNNGWIREALHNNILGIKVEVTNIRSGYTAHQSWDGADTQKYMAGDVLQKFYWKEAVDHVYAILQEQQADGSWKTVGDRIQLDNGYNNWKGIFSAEIDESKKYRVRELITNEEIETGGIYGGTGHFIIDDSSEKILYASDDEENTEHSNPVIRFEYKPVNSDTSIVGAFTVTYEDLDENGNFKIINRKVSSFTAKMQWDLTTEDELVPKPDKIEAVLQYRENLTTDWNTIETVELTPENNWEAFFSTTVEDEVDARAHYRILEKDENGIVENNGEAVNSAVSDGGTEWKVKYTVSYATNNDTGVTTIINVISNYEKVNGCSQGNHDFSALDGIYHQCSVCEHKEKHDFVDGACTVCGLTEPVDKFVKVQAYLDEQIALDFKVFIPESLVEKAEKMEFDVAGVKQYVNFKNASKVTIDNQKCYVFRCELNSTQMDDTIIAKMIYSDETTGSTKIYSIKQYLEKVKETYPDNAELMSLVDAMATFGDCMKAYEQKDMDNVPNVVLTPAEKDYADNYSLDSTGINTDDVISSITPSTARVNMGSLMSVKVKYVCDEEADYTFFVDGQPVTATKLTSDDGKIYYDVASHYIAPVDYGKTIKFTVKLGDAEENYLYSPMMYAIVATSTYADDDNYVSMFNSIIKYHYSALKYNKTKNH